MIQLYTPADRVLREITYAHEFLHLLPIHAGLELSLLGVAESVEVIRLAKEKALKTKD
jgi:hypothetical protein